VQWLTVVAIAALLLLVMRVVSVVLPLCAVLWLLCLFGVLDVVRSMCVVVGMLLLLLVLVRLMLAWCGVFVDSVVGVRVVDVVATAGVVGWCIVGWVVCYVVYCVVICVGVLATVNTCDVDCIAGIAMIGVAGIIIGYGVAVCVVVYYVAVSINMVGGNNVADVASLVCGNTHVVAWC